MNRIAFYAAGALLALCVTGATSTNAATCQLGANGHQIKHIVYLQFDNVHLRRDNPNVPSDLEQIPSLLNFLQGNGTLLANHHTPLIAHTSVDILTSLTGNYGEKMGMPIGNTILYFDPTKTVGSSFTSSFAYWTNNLGTTSVPQLVDQRGKVHPAPWVPFTRAGCDVGAFSLANIELENTSGDVTNVFGAGSPEAQEATNAFNILCGFGSHPPCTPAQAKAKAQPAADFDGIAIHCAQGSALCGNSANARPDILNDEPLPDGSGTGGYVGYLGLFGNKYVAPAINGGQGFVLDLDNNHVADSLGNDGFPGFSPTPSQALGYVAQMLEHGVPVVYLYIADAHDNGHYAGAPVSTTDGTFGPGEGDYVFQLQKYDAAFKTFFARLANDGITKDNTLFVITSDENDHFAGDVTRAAPAGCDGVSTPCTYPVGAKGEVQAKLEQLVPNEFNDTTLFAYDFDSAPGIWIKGNPPQTNLAVRTLEREASTLQAFDPIVNSAVTVMRALADHAEQRLLHMITSDPNRTPNFVLFSNPDFFFTDSGAPNCPAGAMLSTCSFETRNFAWNHGDFQIDITHTWLGLVGPGVRNRGLTDEIFTDHTDIRPTIISLAQLTDDYAHDGRVMFEILEDYAVPQSLRAHRETLSRMAAAYKQINAPVGTLGIKTLVGISTSALKGDDATYAALEAQIVDITNRRNAIANQMIDMLESAAFGGQAIDEQKAKNLIDQAEALLASIN
jgi:hypothetical protein